MPVNNRAPFSLKPQEIIADLKSRLATVTTEMKTPASNAEQLQLEKLALEFLLSKKNEQLLTNCCLRASNNIFSGDIDDRIKFIAHEIYEEASDFDVLRPRYSRDTGLFISPNASLTHSTSPAPANETPAAPVLAYPPGHAPSSGRQREFERKKGVPSNIKDAPPTIKDTPPTAKQYSIASIMGTTTPYRRELYKAANEMKGKLEELKSFFDAGNKDPDKIESLNKLHKDIHTLLKAKFDYVRTSKDSPSVISKNRKELLDLIHVERQIKETISDVQPDLSKKPKI